MPENVTIPDATSAPIVIRTLLKDGVHIPVRAQASAKGIDFSLNTTGALTGLSLLATLASNPGRIGYFIQAQDVFNVVLAFDDLTPAESTAISYFILKGGTAKGQPGERINMVDFPHAGRIRVYSENSGCRYSAREW